ncbi:MAG: hypothetical protein HQL91_13300 [Magnetococcales bacterium]|nr:hypothetical protein [Magnetococcales bacterium]
MNLDPRYELIANVMALYRLEQPDGDAAVLRTGLTVKQISIEAIKWWPQGIDRLELEDFRALLDEMVDLGVFARYGVQPDRFGLRSAQVAQMLGRQEEIEYQILQIASKIPQVDYDAAQFCRRVTLDDPEHRSPLVDRALADLFDSGRPGPRIFVAAPKLWGTDIAVRLRDLAGKWVDDKGLFSSQIHDDSISALRDLFERHQVTKRTVIVLSERKWEEKKEIEWTAKQSAIKSGKVVPIFMASPAWLTRYRLNNETEVSAQIVTPRPWGEMMLRAWLEERDIRQLDQPALRKWLLAGTGGAPMLLDAVHPMLSEVVASGNDPEKTIMDWADQQRVSPDDAGIQKENVKYFFELVSLVDSDQPQDFATVDECFAPSERDSRPDLKRLLRLWADLGLVRQGNPEQEGVALTLLGQLVARTGRS